MRTLIHDFPIIHTIVGLIGNLMFFLGSVFFLDALSQFKVLGVWLFIGGALFMFLGSAGELLRKYWQWENGEWSLIPAGRRAREAEDG